MSEWNKLAKTNNRKSWTNYLVAYALAVASIVLSYRAGQQDAVCNISEGMDEYTKNLSKDEK